MGSIDHDLLAMEGGGFHSGDHESKEGGSSHYSGMYAGMGNLVGW